MIDAKAVASVLVNRLRTTIDMADGLAKLTASGAELEVKGTDLVNAVDYGLAVLREELGTILDGMNKLAAAETE